MEIPLYKDIYNDTDGTLELLTLQQPKRPGTAMKFETQDTLSWHTYHDTSTCEYQG